MENWLSHLGAGTKHLTERIAEYPPAGHDPHLYYTYEPSSPAHAHGASSKHHHGGGHKGQAAMSALTLLAFLFFLHILQQCLKEHTSAMSTPQLMVVSAGRRGDGAATRASADEAGLGRPATGAQHRLSNRREDPDRPAEREVFLTRIATAERAPTVARTNILNYANKSSVLDGFVSAMDEK